ncbi:MAG: DUF885 domain-containing protein [Chitinophagaceae bacterium]|nr:DUF885 domain-containing protein [Chitinophagaceae bacterium]
MKKSVLVVLLLCIAFGSRAQQTSEIHHLMVNFQADYGSLTRFYAINLSPERTNRLRTFYQSYLSQLDAINFDKLSKEGQVDYILFKRDLKFSLQELESSAKEYESLNTLFPFASEIYSLEQTRRRGTTINGEQEARKLIALQGKLVTAIQQAKQNKALPEAQAKRATEALMGMQDALKSYYQFYFGYDPMFTWWADKPYQKTDSLLKAYTNLVKNNVAVSTQKDDGSGIIGNPIGAAALQEQLSYEMIPYTAEELVAIANKEFAWCDAEMLKASKELGFGDNWKAALEKVKNSYVPPGEQPAAILDLMNQSLAFLKKYDLITIPPIAEETWRMGMMSPQRQLTSPFFLGGEQILISYPTNTMQHEDKLMSMRGNNPHFSRATVHHELIAGHHLQQYMNNRFRVYRQFDTPFWTEGWALYWEMILWNMNFPRNAEDRVGMLFWRMHRCARIIFSLNYHLGKWTPQQCIDFLVDRVGHERANAEGEVRRSFTGGYGPLYQIAYMIGALQFFELKRELVDTKKMTYKQFHDAVMKENAMPVEMVRALLKNQPLTKDFETNWKFYRF